MVSGFRSIAHRLVSPVDACRIPNIAAVSANGAASEVFAPGVLAGQVILITGGGTGLGLGAALELARCGASVVVTGRRPEVLSEALAALAAVSCGDASPAMVVGDVRSADEARRIVSFALDRYGRLDTLVNNAGGQYFVPAE